ncbi:MAG: hypothetical protein LH650_10230 [Chloroflexi bacterium]|nr:hypothetical protein [Chloroflexota bacterium]
MRKIREILRLILGDGLSRRQAAAAAGVPTSTIADQLARANRVQSMLLDTSGGRLAWASVNIR